MPLNLRHKNWDPSGRTHEVLDELNQPYDPPRFCYTGVVGEQCVQDAEGKWQPYVYENNEIKYSNDNIGCDFQADKQVIKKAGQTLCQSLKLFVQREIDGEWVNQPHGAPTRQIKHNKRWKDKELIDDTGYCIGWLEFPEAQYDLQVGIQTGRSQRAIMGFRFRAPISANIRMQIVNDGIDDIGNYSLIKADGPQGTRIVGVKFKEIQYRWTYQEAVYHSMSVEDSTNYPGKKKGIITVGPFDYTANEWVEIVPLTWGLTENVDDCYEQNETTYTEHTYANLLHLGDAGSFGFYERDIGWTWGNVTVPAGATAENGCYVKIEVTGGLNDGGEGNLQAVDSRDLAAWGAGSRPSTVTKHGATVPFDFGIASTSENSGEIKTLIQARLDDDHQSGDEIGIVAISTATAGAADLTYVACNHHVSRDGAELYIVYTAAAGGRPLPQRVLSGPFAGPLGGPF